MAKRTLTDRTLKALKPAKRGKRYDLMDSVVPGLGFRITETGHKSFTLVARFPGSKNPTRRALGDYGALTLQGARRKAREWLETLRRGVDPREEEERQRAAKLRERRNTFAAVAEDFINDKLPGERKGREVERDIRREFLPRWGKLAITQVIDAHVREVVKAAKDRGSPYQAHNLAIRIRRSASHNNSATHWLGLYVNLFIPSRVRVAGLVLQQAPPGSPTIRSSACRCSRAPPR